MKSINLCSIIILIIISSAIGQDNADYFPYEKNNYWEYLWLETGYPDTIVSLSVFDSVDNQWRKIAIFDSYFINPIKPPAILPDSGTYIIDSSLNVFSNFTLTGGGCVEEYLLVYKLNGKRGDQWVLCDVGGGGFHYEMARITEVLDTVLFGIQTKLMWIDYYLAEDSTDTTGLGRGYDGLVKGIGLYRRQSEGWTGIGLKGAVINGILYGDTTTVGVHEPNWQIQKVDFQLYQNFPNPFNPATTIKFELSSGGIVSLIIYDLLGNEVIRLIDKIYYPSGKFEKIWSGTDNYSNILGSGVYFYRLSIDNQSISKSMILIK